ncbi:hypothetical protein MVES1_002887 [Malassezia vespertilionis]|uniref:Uncharacterized protein n=1 Tax=Malassezia vespertilionis TaxID=2020962 RepID=A0A2N1J985_9BASI|nr:uncharacterized protein MVES1_002887 [Malassezia vespertilionis]PKI83117.1 hypothetical protein MVES_002736 [Malassezia vespertilionis]WFD07521.1 hypothetical protein MVES1_002887 [Malassezia vespertilionis]
MEEPFLEKRAAWELGYSTDRALPSLPFPVMTSVSRSTYRNLSSLNTAPFQGYSDDFAPPVPDKSDVSDMVRDQVLKSRASMRHISTPTMSFSLDSNLSSLGACGIRESNLARPCITHGASGWGIFPSHVTEEEEDVSFHGSQQPMNVV